MTQIWNEKIALLLLYYFQNFICSYKQQVVHRVFYLMESFALLYLQLEDHSETFAQFMQTMTQRKQTPGWFSVGIFKYKPGYKSHDPCYNSSALIGWNYSVQTREQIL